MYLCHYQRSYRCQKRNNIRYQKKNDTRNILLYCFQLRCPNQNRIQSATSRRHIPHFRPAHHHRRLFHRLACLTSCLIGIGIHILQCTCWSIRRLKSSFHRHSTPPHAHHIPKFHHRRSVCIRSDYTANARKRTQAQSRKLKSIHPRPLDCRHRTVPNQQQSGRHKRLHDRSHSLARHIRSRIQQCNLLNTRHLS